jgi:hypothetical protein
MIMVAFVSTEDREMTPDEAELADLIGDLLEQRNVDDVDALNALTTVMFRIISRGRDLRGLSERETRAKCAEVFQRAADTYRKNAWKGLQS